MADFFTKKSLILYYFQANTQVIMRKMGEMDVHYNETNILNCTTYRDFWISWKRDSQGAANITVGKGQTPFQV